MFAETDLDLGAGRTVHVYDSGPAGGRGSADAGELAVFWHHGAGVALLLRVSE